MNNKKAYYVIDELSLKNFKGFDDTQFYTFGFDSQEGLHVLSGPNGFGKTTFFDAVELFMTKKLTGFVDDIEGAKKSERNVFLNSSSEMSESQLILKVTDTKSELQRIFVMFIKDKKTSLKLIEETIEIYEYPGEEILTNDEIISWVKSNDVPQIDSLANELKFSRGMFNKLYLVSQKDSIHFLKESITKRDTALEDMLGIDSQLQFNEFIQNTKNQASFYSAVKTSISNHEKKADQLYEKLKELTEKEKRSVVEYDSFSNNKTESMFLIFDEEEINIEKYKLADINHYVERFKLATEYYYNDYPKYKANHEIEMLIKSPIYLECFAVMFEYYDDGKINEDKIKKMLSKYMSKKTVLEKAEYFTMNLFKNDIQNNFIDYNSEDLLVLSKELSILDSFDIPNLNKSVVDLQDLNKGMKRNEKEIENLQRARKQLQEHRIDKKDPHCPYCNRDYVSVEALEEAYRSVEESLKLSEGMLSHQSNNLRKYILSEFEKIKEVLVTKLPTESLTEVIKTINYCETILQSSEINDVFDKINSLLSVDESFIKSSYNERYQLLLNRCQDSKQVYNELSFEQIYERERLEPIYELLENDESLLLAFKDSQRVAKKEEYIYQLFNQVNPKEKKDIEERLSNELEKIIKMKWIFNKLQELKKQYKWALREFKEKMKLNIQIPLLVYSGKILQNTQSGLGVFINEDFKFTIGRGNDNDIVNMFSAGQLSGFNIAFMFTLNKLYSGSDKEQLGFVLIDDPIQNMDDINMISFIQLLTAEFGHKQIVISTHSDDIELYIRYKFNKKNINNSSFNVKEKLFR